MPNPEVDTSRAALSGTSGSDTSVSSPAACQASSRGTGRFATATTSSSRRAGGASASTRAFTQPSSVVAVSSEPPSLLASEASASSR